MTPNADAKTRPRLSRERVLAAAIHLADQGGVESLTMRKLARELGVEAMSLYNHVANKRDLVSGIVDLVVSEFELPSESADWEAAVRRCAVSAHEVLLRHPWACALASAPSGGAAVNAARMRYMEWLLRQLREAGFSPELTFHAYHALDSHIFGFTQWQLGHLQLGQGLTKEELAGVAASFLRELPASEFPYLVEHAHQHLEPLDDGVNAFQFGLDLILDGLKRVHDTPAR
jgi:AcrR family transcriptional regulator